MLKYNFLAGTETPKQRKESYKTEDQNVQTKNSTARKTSYNDRKNEQLSLSPGILDTKQQKNTNRKS